MGPRSIERGEEERDAEIEADGVASMGPRSIERGELANPPPTPSHSVMLQWGRAQLSAER